MIRPRWLLLGLALAAGACGSPDRDEARQSLVQQLEDGGLDERTAECVVDAFFADKTNDELKSFFERDQLTPEEAVEFASLGERCTPES